MVSKYGSKLARSIAQMIWEAAQQVPHSPLKKIWLYGDVAKAGMGSSINFIFEVDLVTFSRYVEFFWYVSEGVRAFTGEARDNVIFDPSSLRGERRVAAFMTARVDADRLHLNVLEDSIDIIVFPTGWDNVASAMHHGLKATLRDPDHLQGIVGSKVQLFPALKVLSRV